MSRVCEVTGKRTRFGNQITRRGLAKRKGGVGKKTTGINRRTFKPNLQFVRIVLPNGGVRRMRVAASVIKKGVITTVVDGRLMSFPLVKAARGRTRKPEVTPPTPAQPSTATASAEAPKS
jgi:large subunit ribosomal protein L28